MKRFRNNIALITGLLLVPAAVFAQNRPDEIQQLYDQYRSGAVKGNADKIAQLYAEDGRMNQSSVRDYMPD